MKSFILHYDSVKFILSVTIFLIIFDASRAQNFDDEYDKQWIKVEALMKKSLPQSASEIVEEIIRQAKKDNNQPQQVKASIYKIEILKSYEEEADEKAILLINNELKNALFPATAIYHSLLAELYYQYYAAHRFEWLTRSVTGQFTGEDIKTWDLQKLMAKVIEHHLEALKNAEDLKKIKREDYQVLLQEELFNTKEERADAVAARPTLFDFLSHRAIDRFMHDETSLNRPSDQFLIDNPLYLSSFPEFINTRLATKDSLSLKFYALKLLQNLLVFHQKDADPVALIDADLKRLEYVFNQSVIDNKEYLYLQALEKLQQNYAGSSVSADVAYKRAQYFANRGNQYNPPEKILYKNDLVQAYQIGEQINTLFPKSGGAKNCRLLNRQIQEQSLTLVVDDVVLPDKPVLGLLTYKNFREVYYRIIQIEPAKEKEIRQSADSKKMLKEYLSMKPAFTGSFILPYDPDYQKHKLQLPLPGLASGYYIVLLSPSIDFNLEKVPVAYTSFAASSLSYISRKSATGEQDVYVVDRQTGKTIKGVTVEAWITDYDYKSRTRKDVLWKTLLTDNEGYVKISSPGERKSKSFYLVLTSGKDKLVSDEYFYISDYSGPVSKKRESTFIFTDRAIYRPGQIIYYKGIMVEGEGNDLVVRPDFKTTVALYDVNGRLISENSVTTNEFGSFSGIFTAPVGVLNGEMRISNEYGSARVRVEEYKRPRFETKILPLEGEYALNASVTVKGNALNYAGNPVDKAKVNFRVIRRAYFPYWYGYGRMLPNASASEISQGTTMTNDNGEFEIIFQALPDKAIPKTSHPVFRYEIIADVTDINGETRTSSASFSASYASFILGAGIPDEINSNNWQKLILSAKNLAGRSVDLKAKVIISQLHQSERLYRSRKWERPDQFLMNREEFYQSFPLDLYDNEDDKTLWKAASVKIEKTVSLPADSVIILSDIKSWPAGDYRIECSSIDQKGDTVIYRKNFTLFSGTDNKVPGNIMFWTSFPQDPVEPEAVAKVFLGSKAKNVRVLYELVKGKEVLERKWLTLNNELITLPVAVKKSYRGNLGVNLLLIKDNRYYQETGIIIVPYSNKALDISFGTFRDHLQPGQAEEWQLKISGKMKEKVAAELLLDMYDVSLDAFVKHQWPFDLYYPENYFQPWKCQDVFSLKYTSQSYFHQKPPTENYYFRKYDRMIFDNDYNSYQVYSAMEDLSPAKGERKNIRTMGVMNVDDVSEQTAMNAKSVTAVVRKPEQEEQETGTPVLLAPVRAELKETAFFFPDLKTDENGNIIVKFNLPESLTRWKLMGLAHTKDLKTGFITKEITAQKELMVFPNPPRFFREGDKLSFSVKISSLSTEKLEGNIGLQLFDAYNMNEITGELLTEKNKAFTVGPGSSTAVSWEINTPSKYQAITWRITAVSGKFSDGEESTVPVLSNRILVTESQPLPVKGKGKFSFILQGLAKQENMPSKTLQNNKLSLEFTSNPAWYAVQALPYLMEFPYECSEQLFNRFYANRIATYLAGSNPDIKKVFDTWSKYTPSALLSNLEKNQDLKTLALEETPWVMEARDETERKQRIGILFDINRMSNESKISLEKMSQLQTPNGGWPWFAGMPDDRYITQYILTGYGHLLKLGIFEEEEPEDFRQMILQGLQYADQRLKDEYDDLLKYNGKSLQDNHLNHSNIQFLYLRSFYLDEDAIDTDIQEAYQYFRGQAIKYWSSQTPYMQGMIALALFRSGDIKTPREILRSLKERALHTDELGMYWRDGQSGMNWHQQGIAAQALLIEAFGEISNDSVAVEDMKLWLLKQKQTNDWKSTTATADACYALLLSGKFWLKTGSGYEIQVGRKVINPATDPQINTEAGTGYFRTSWLSDQITPDMAKVVITKSDESIAWGALYWQYFEDMDKIPSAAGNLKIDRQLFIKKNTSSGPVLERITPLSPIKVGDILMVRITLVTDRDMEYIHLKDQRAAGMEPVDVLSGYHFQDGTGYYMNTRDAATHFFFSFLPKGTRIFEYSLKADQKGEFSMGITQVECMYAPEFMAHSEGLRIKIE